MQEFMEGIADMERLSFNMLACFENGSWAMTSAWNT